MKPKLHIASIFATLTIGLFTPNAMAITITWDGFPGGDFFDPGNWDDSTGPTANTAFVGDIVIPPGSSPVASGKLILATGSTLTVTDSTLDFTGNNFEGVQNPTTDAVFNFNNSTVTVNSVSFDAVLNLNGNSTLNLLGVNNTVNGNNTPTNNTRVNLGDGSKVVHVNGNNGAGGATVGSRIFRSASGADFATDFASLPLEQFILAGDTTPFAAPNSGAFTITALNSNANRDILVGYEIMRPVQVPPVSPVVWLPTYRTATDWQINLDNPQISDFGWAEITDVYLADLNGDGLSDKVMRQTANNGGTNPSQIIASYTTAPPTGFATSTNLNPPDGDIDVPFGFLSAANTSLVFGDLDGDGIDDTGVTVDGGNPNVNVGAGALTWGMLKSNGQIGIANNFSFFAGWSVFGDSTLDKPYMGDFNGDGIDDRLIYRSSTNQAFIDLSTAGSFGDGAADYTISIGIPGDRLHISDINGDGKDDLVLARDTNLLPPPNDTPGLQTIYGFYNDGNGFATLNGASPDITDFWGAGGGILFGKITLSTNDLSNFRITQITSAGPELDFAGTFFAPITGTYEIRGNLDLVSPWQLLGSVVVTTPGSNPFSVSDAQLDTVFGPASRPKLFLRVVKNP